MVNIKRMRDRLPSSVGEVAYDSVWTLAFEGFLILSVTASFMMLGSELGPAGYGEYVGLFAIITPVSAIGSAASLATLQACFQEQRPVQSVVNVFLTVVLLGGALATAIVAVVAPLILDELSMTSIVAIAFGELVFLPIVRVSAGAIRALHGVPMATRTELTVLVAKFVALTGLFVVGELTVQNLAIGWFIASGVVVIYVLFFRLRSVGIVARPSVVALRDIRMVFALGAPIYISDFQTNGDKVVLNGAGLQGEAGLYGAAFRVATLATTPLRAMDIAIFHRILEHDDNARGVHLRRARRYTTWSLGVVVPIGLVLLLAAPILPLLVGDEFDGSVEMIRWLVLWLPFKTMAQPPLAGLLGLGRLGVRLIILCTTAGLSMGLYLLLIPDMGWEGAVIGTVVAEIALAVLSWMALIWAQGKRDAELAAHAARKGEPSFSI